MDGIVETVSETFFNTGSTRLSVKWIDDRGWQPDLVLQAQ